MLRNENMILIVCLLAISATAFTEELIVNPKICPSCVVVGNSCFNALPVLELKAQFRNAIVIHEMGILRANNTLYYSFEPPIEDREYYKMGFINLDSHTQAGIIDSPELILNFGTFDVDQDNELIYLGGSDGIFVLDAKESKLSRYSSPGDTIKSLFFKTNVNFIANDNRGIIVKRGDSFRILLEDVLIKNFVITKYDVVVYLSHYGLFVAKGDLRIRISKNAFFRGLNMDLEGTVYTWWLDEMYKVIIEKNLEHSRIEKIASLPVAIGAMVFDNDNNILFSVEKELFRLIPTEIGCSVVQDKNVEIEKVEHVSE